MIETNRRGAGPVHGVQAANQGRKDVLDAAWGVPSLIAEADPRVVDIPRPSGGGLRRLEQGRRAGRSARRGCGGQAEAEAEDRCRRDQQEFIRTHEIDVCRQVTPCHAPAHTPRQFMTTH